MNVLPTAAAELATAVASAYGTPRKLCGPKASARVLATVYTADAATTPTSDTSPITCWEFGLMVDGEGSAAATAATAGCWLVAWVDGFFAGATALRRVVAGAAEGCGSAAIGFAGLVDAMV